MRNASVRIRKDWFRRSLEGAVVTIDAIACNPQIAKSIRDASGSTARTPVEFFTGLTGPGRFGSGIETATSSSGGDIVGVEDLGGEGRLPLYSRRLRIRSLSETSTYLSATFGSLGLMPGTYVYTCGTGDHADSSTISCHERARDP